MTDVELLAAFGERGDEGAFGEIVRRHVDVVYGAALRRVRDPGMAEDVTQAVFLVLVKKAKGFRKGERLVGWLLTVTRLCAMDARKIAGRRARHERAAGAERVITGGAVMREDLRAVVDEGLERLSEGDRTAVVLRYLEERPLEEVGVMMGVSAEAAKKRVGRAVEKLRGVFGEKGVHLSTAMVMEGLVRESGPSGLAEKVCAGVMGKGVASGAAVGIAKGAVKVMAWTTAKIVGAVAAGVIVVAVGATGVVMVADSGDGRPAVILTEAPATHPKEAVRSVLEGLPVSKLVMAGSSRAEDLALLNGLHTRKGEGYSAAALDQDVRLLSALENFRTVRANVVPVMETGTKYTGVVVEIIVEARLGATGTQGGPGYFYVAGEVKHPGVYALAADGGITLKMAIAASGMKNSVAATDYVVTMMRRIDATHEKEFVFGDLSKILDGVVDEKLQANDIIRVIERKPLEIVGAPHAGEAGSVRILGGAHPGEYLVHQGEMLTVKQVMVNLAGARVEDMAGRVVWLIRDGKKEPEAKVSWDEMMAGIAADRYVQPGDTVVVPAVEQTSETTGK